MRVHELAKELGLSSKELLEALAAAGGVRTPPPAPRNPRKPKAKKEPAPALTVVPSAEVPAAVEPKPAAPTPPAPSAAAPSRRRREAGQPEQLRGGAVLQVVRGATPQQIAEKTDRSPGEIVKLLFMAGEMVTATTSLTDEAISVVANGLDL